MKKPKCSIMCVLAAGFALLLLVTGCSTRSISDSGPDGGRGRYYYPYAGVMGGYQGELSEFDVLGVDRTQQITEGEISAALKTGASAARLSRASRILLIQSGADFPDSVMIDAMRQRFFVAPFSGKPVLARTIEEGRAVSVPTQNFAYSKSLRLTAAQGGYDKIVCYWGQLESAEVNQATKIISWVPIVGYMIPDVKHTMRIVLKAAIIDVETGQWTFVMPPPAMSSDFSSLTTRDNADQVLVNRLKEKGYQDLAKLLFDAYTQ